MDGLFLGQDNVLIRYDKLKKEDFLLSGVWVRYHLSVELDLFKKNGITDDWIYKNIFTYEEEKKGDGVIYYAILGNKFYLKKDYVVVKSTILLNGSKYFIGYQSLINKEPVSVEIFLGKRVLFFAYTDDPKDKYLIKTFKSLEKAIGEKINSFEIYTENSYKHLVKPKGIVRIGADIQFYNIE